MRKTLFILVIICVIILPCLDGLEVKADVFSPLTPIPRISITINPDGSITQPGTYITQSGNNYTLEKEVDGNLTVLRSNIIINGNGNAVFGELVIGTWGTQPIYQPIAGLSFTSNVTVQNFNVTGAGVNGFSGFGIQLVLTSNSRVSNNTVSKCGIGILSLEGQTSAVDIEGGGANTIIGNTLSDNMLGIVFHETEKNVVLQNAIVNTRNPYSSSLGIPGYGLVFWSASNNVLYRNNFVNNQVQVYDAPPFSSNVWDYGYPLAGNYWSDYLTKYPNATEIDHSGTGRTPYMLDQNNTDFYPLMQQANVSDVLPTPTPGPTSTATTSVPELSWLVFVLLLISVFCVAMVVKHGKNRLK